tara:strand:- start:581 stop:1618 length:1038 start_codon:yes stop_codon:yes gene_type:complete
MANISDPLDINMLQGGASAAAADSVGQEFVPEVWGQAILDKFRTNTVMLPLANDLSSEANGTDKIHLPHIGVTPLASVSQGTAIDADVTTDGSMVATETALNIDQHKVTSLFIPDALKAQSSYNLFNLYSDQLAYAIGRGVDNYLMYKVVDNLTTAHGGTSGATQDTVDMLEVGDALSTSNIDDIFKAVILETGSAEGWTMVLSPTLYASLAALDSGAGFVRGTAGPLGAGFASTGVAGNILGMNVVVSQSPYLDVASVSADNDKGITAWTGFDTNDSTNDDILRGFCIHNSALYYAAAQAPRVQQSYQHRYLSDLVTVDAIYGCAVRNSATAGDRRIIGLSKNV